MVEDYWLKLLEVLTHIFMLPLPKYKETFSPHFYYNSVYTNHNLIQYMKVEFKKKHSCILSKGIPYFFNMEGEIRVILWRRKASHPWELLGKNPNKARKAKLYIFSLNQIWNLCNIFQNLTVFKLGLKFFIMSFLGSQRFHKIKCTS